jgi:hypothetical protein
MIKQFREKLEKNGQSLKWFHRENIWTNPSCDVSYSAFIQQINDFASLNPEVEKEIKKYLEK